MGLFLDKLYEQYKNKNFEVNAENNLFGFNLTNNKYTYRFEYLPQRKVLFGGMFSLLHCGIYDDKNKNCGSFDFKIINGHLEYLSLVDNIKTGKKNELINVFLNENCFDSDRKFTIREKMNLDVSIDYIFNIVCEEYENNTDEFRYIFDYALSDITFNLYDTFVKLDDNGKKLLIQMYLLNQ